MSALLEVRNVSLSFRGVKAISDLSFSVKLGEICALIGPNGAGKSSLLNILNGVYRADAGQLFFAAEPLRRPHPLKAARLGIGRTFQNNALFKKNERGGQPAYRPVSLPAHVFFSNRPSACRVPGARRGRSPSVPSGYWNSLNCRPGATSPWAAWPTACRNAWSWAGH
nr:hypothetical protein GCM10020185_85100 [Pseudomonas brassicacearum subsp. brassicacearum]